MIKNTCVICLFCLLFSFCKNGNNNSNSNPTENEKCFIHSIVKTFPFQVGYDCKAISNYKYIPNEKKLNLFFNEIMKYREIGGLDYETQYWGIYKCFFNSDTSSIIEINLIPNKNNYTGRLNNLMKNRVAEIKSLYPEFIYFNDSIYSNKQNQIGQYRYLRKSENMYKYFLYKTIFSKDYILSIAFHGHSTSNSEIDRKVIECNTIIDGLSVYNTQ